MLVAQAISETGALSLDAVRHALAQGLEGRFQGQRVLVLIPDHTRSAAAARRSFASSSTCCTTSRQLDFMVALGTHPALPDESLLRLVGISAEEREPTFRHVGLLNHAWDDPAALTSLGVIGQDEIREIAGPAGTPRCPSAVDIRINKAVLEYDHILILGPVFPHEVVGFSGGAKYLFPGISGPDMINATHWLGRAGHRGRHDRHQGYAGARDDSRRGAPPGDPAHAGRAGGRRA